MTITIREVDPQHDYERVAEIINFYEPDPVTADQLRGSGTDKLAGQIVAVNANGLVMGYGSAGRSTWMRAGHFMVSALVDPAYCRQGIGTRLHESNVSFAREQGAVALETWVFDDRAESLRFAEKHGFKVERHIFESTIDLHSFDPTPFAGLVEGVEASGIRFASIAEVGNTHESRQKLWEINRAISLDMPNSTGEVSSFDEFEKMCETSKSFREDGQLLALDGERYIGLSRVAHLKETNSAYNQMTGVLPEYRGRKIAQALKLLSIRTAKSWGVDYIRTNNDSENGPILAINRKLGYAAEPGGYRMIRQLEREPS